MGSFNLFSLLTFTQTLLLLILNQNVLASLTIFKANSQINFNETLKNIHLNNQYQYYTLANVDMPGRWYSYENLLSSHLLFGYFNSSTKDTKDIYHCRLSYRLLNHLNHTATIHNHPSQNNLNWTTATSNNNSLNENKFNSMNPMNTTKNDCKINSPLKMKPR
ncbi:hypothetical protein LY90DRAFT_502437 [Neocallimastix californiae]|uniref:Uncharacterized protein n=1 Tax=Neocallimastix californiae TaxID=1754190 RepID=A0A1Y2ETZ2_9FUNG|nr:hypothetical protein LY90DRAFT_502437 [Neocallimastix californiae]|eukprot:ORY74646.1 hypothetical protein LY90DRAFT_502437 [Neocallimastix californiae]